MLSHTLFFASSSWIRTPYITVHQSVRHIYICLTVLHETYRHCYSAAQWMQCGISKYVSRANTNCNFKSARAYSRLWCVVKTRESSVYSSCKITELYVQIKSNWPLAGVNISQLIYGCKVSSQEWVRVLVRWAFSCAGCGGTCRQVRQDLPHTYPPSVQTHPIWGRTDRTLWCLKTHATVYKHTSAAERWIDDPSDARPPRVLLPNSSWPNTFLSPTRTSSLLSSSVAHCGCFAICVYSWPSSWWEVMSWHWQL